MSPHRARYFLFLILCVALTAAVIWYLIPGGPAPGVISTPDAAGPSTPHAGMPSASTDISQPFGVAGHLSPGDDEPPQIASLEERSDPDHFWKNVEDMLALSIRKKLTGARLSEGDTRELIDTIRDMQASLVSLRETRRTPENAADIKALAGRIEESSQRIQEMTGMSAAEFLNRLTMEGIDNDKPEEGAVVLEYLAPPDR